MLGEYSDHVCVAKEEDIRERGWNCANKRGEDNEQTAPSEISRSASFSLIVPSRSYDLCARSVTGHRSQTT